MAHKKSQNVLKYLAKPLPKNWEPGRLTKSKYELIFKNKKGHCMAFVTQKINREHAISILIQSALSGVYTRDGVTKDLINTAFKIYVTENGKRELLIDSKAHKRFVLQFK